MSRWGLTRRKPYTEGGIKRLTCIRCGLQASSQWQICADLNNYRPVCRGCDVLLNQLVLKFMGHPWVTKLIDEYQEELPD